MDLCVFQGTFNPIHKAHINVAEFALNYYKFDKILFIPAYIPPHKEVDKTLALHRFNMVKLAIEDNDKFAISDIEYKRERRSYTYLTILELKKNFNIHKRINFLIGTDAFEKITTWYETDKLKELIHFIVYPRCKNFNTENYTIFKDLGYDFEFAPLEYLDISSTELRENINSEILANNFSIPKVKKYIKDNNLYEKS